MISRTSDRPVPYSADLHIHSALSPCAGNRMVPHEVLKRIIGLGVEIFSITDHNSMFNCSAFARAAGEHNILFIPGIELQSSEEIHLLGYFPDISRLSKFHSTVVKPGILSGITNDPAQFGNQLKMDDSGETIGEEEDMLSMPLDVPVNELVDAVHDFEGVAVAAHIDRGFSLISHLGFMPPELKIDAVEIWNAAKIGEMRSEFLRGRELNIISSSDSHHLDMIKAPKMRFWLKYPDVGSCLECIRGEGPGRITVRDDAKMRSGRAKRAAGPAGASVSIRDWRSLYG